MPFSTLFQSCTCSNRYGFYTETDWVKISFRFRHIFMFQEQNKFESFFQTGMSTASVTRPIWVDEWCRDRYGFMAGSRTGLDSWTSQRPGMESWSVSGTISGTMGSVLVQGLIWVQHLGQNHYLLLAYSRWSWPARSDMARSTIILQHARSLTAVSHPCRHPISVKSRFTWCSHRVRCALLRFMPNWRSLSNTFLVGHEPVWSHYWFQERYRFSIHSRTSIGS